METKGMDVAVTPDQHGLLSGLEISGVDRDGQYFRQVLEQLPAAVYMTDAEGRLTFFNEAAAALWGRRPELGEDWWCGSWQLYWPDGTPMNHDECPMAVTLKTGNPVHGVEAIAERPDGTRFPFIPYPTLLRDAEGRIIGAVNLLIDTSERKQTDAAAHRLAAIVASSDDAIISKDLNGIITSWNAGAQHIFGYTAEEAIGKPVTILIPVDRHDEEPGILRRIRGGESLEHYETVRQRKDGTLIDISLTVSPIRDAQGRIIGASKIARDITERKRAERLLEQQTLRLATLNRISRVIFADLDLERTVQTVTDVATELAGAKFGAFFYNVTNDSGESYTLFTLSGAPREDFETFGLPRNTAMFEPTFRGTAIVRSNDIRSDPRYGQNPPHFGMPKGHLPVVSYLAVPVIGRSGDVIGGLFFGHDQPGVFQKEAEDIVVGIAAHAAIAIDNAQLHRATQQEVEHRRQTEAEKELLLKEIQHRIRNTLTTVQVIARQTFRHVSPDERRVFGARLQALAGAHDLLTRANWDQAAITEVVQNALAPFRDRNGERFVTSGPEVPLKAAKSLLLAMILHELGTNASKYGALSNDSGRVALNWDLADSAEPARLSLEWRESGGPRVEPPRRKGFGSTLITRALESGEGKAQVDFAPTGVVYRLLLTL
jgi:PAS domain S-box-containing protein